MATDFTKILDIQSGVRVLNCTPHELIFRAEDGSEVKVEKCGATLMATPDEKTAGTVGAAQLVRTVFVTSEEGLAELTEIEAQAPGVLVIGSIISAQAYPGRVVSPVSAKGFERVAPAEKRMDPAKFTTFA